tara:strand:- start:812 stop:1246 length:435 start_codon:yes stop_codon:yes gene_type:complete
MSNQIKKIQINYAEFAYFSTLPHIDQLNYFFDVYQGQSIKPNLDLKEFFSQIDSGMIEDEDPIVNINTEMSDSHDRVDVMIDDQYIMIESNSLKAIRIIMTRFIESGYLISRDKENEKMFKRDKTTRYLRVYSIIDQAAGICLN